MKLPYNAAIHFSFWATYVAVECMVQHDMSNPQWISHHLSDVFAGPGILFSYILIPIIVLDRKSLICYGPLVSMVACIIYELLKNTDMVDIYCYVFGTALFYLTCYLILICQTKTTNNPLPPAN